MNYIKLMSTYMHIKQLIISVIYIKTKQNSAGIYCQTNEKLAVKTRNTS